MDEIVKEIRKVIPCRDSQISQLLGYIGEPDEPVPPCVCVHGDTATGKSASINAVVDYLGYRRVLINAIECYSAKLMFETILDCLSGHVYSREQNYATKHKCDNMKDFILHLNNLQHGYEPLIIIIDKAERLREMDDNILQTFTRLKEFCHLNICTILISSIVFEKYYLITGLRGPMKIFFPQYTKEEIYKIIFLNHVSCANYVIAQSKGAAEHKEDILRVDLFANYLNAFLSVFYRMCRDLVELRHMARVNFVKYCEPILDGSVKADDVTKLWRNVAPTLKSSLEVLYLRLNASKGYKLEQEEPLNKDIELRMERLGITKLEKEKNLTDELTCTKTFAQSFELPFYAKFLLIAAYLASYNPAKEDKRLFMKYHGKQKKRLQQVNSKAVLSDKLNSQLGPQFFTLDRLLAIFYSILEERCGLTAGLLCQLSSLVSLQLLARSSDGCRYRCTASYEVVHSVSRMVGFHLRKYLYDFI